MLRSVDCEQGFLQSEWASLAIAPHIDFCSNIGGHRALVASLHCVSRLVRICVALHFVVLTIVLGYFGLKYSVLKLSIVLTIGPSQTVRLVRTIALPSNTRHVRSRIWSYTCLPIGIGMAL